MIAATAGAPGLGGTKRVRGDRSRETELAARPGVSRTPVSEAIRQLDGDVIVTHGPRIGASIRMLDHAEAMELYAMRANFEAAQRLRVCALRARPDSGPAGTLP